MADANHLIIHPGLNLEQTALGATNFALDQTTDQLEFIFQAEEAITITRVGFRYGARTGTPPSYKASLQGVGTTGNPDGTIKGGGSPASVTFTPPADATWDATWRWVTLANAYTCTRGEFLALVIAYNSGTVDGSNFSSITSVDNGSIVGGGGSHGLPYVISNNAGSRSRTLVRPVFAYSSASAVYGNPLLSVTQVGPHNLSSTPDEFAMRFVLPSGWGSTYQVSGVSWLPSVMPAGKSLKIQLYSGTTVLQSLTYDTDFNQSTNGRLDFFSFPDTTLATLNFGTEYRIGFQPQDAAGDYYYNAWNQTSNAEWAAYPLGIEWYMSTRTDAGAWTDVTTARLVGGCLVLKDITVETGGGAAGAGGSLGIITSV